MIRVIIVLLLVTAASAAQPQATPLSAGFDPQSAAAVYGAALSFTAPRDLQGAPIPQLTLWGLQGLRAIDPALDPALLDGKLGLRSGGRIIFTVDAPKDSDAAGWGNAAASLTEAAWRVSLPLQRAGSEAIFESFFHAMFGHLDPYSHYVSPARAAADEAARQGRAGLGVTLARRGQSVVVQAVSPDSPALAASIHPGDRILAVGGQKTDGQTPAAVSAWLSGPDGSEVRVSWSTLVGRIHAVTLTREVIPPETVFTRQLDKFLLLRLTGFNRNTDVLFAAKVQESLARMDPLHGIVIDLRGNRGGLLAEAVTVANNLLPEGVIAITQGRDPGANRQWRSRGGELAKDVPVVVLVDANTASAAEVLAAALADRGRGVVVGSATTGKGLVQAFTVLPNGAELFVTWSRLLAPRGWPIQELGVLPQVCTSFGSDDLDQQLSALEDGEQPMEAALVHARNARAPISPTQAVAIRATCPAAGGSPLDIDAARELLDDPAAYAAALMPPITVPLAAGP